MTCRRWSGPEKRSQARQRSSPGWGSGLHRWRREGTQESVASFQSRAFAPWGVVAMRIRCRAIRRLRLMGRVLSVEWVGKWTQFIGWRVDRCFKRYSPMNLAAIGSSVPAPQPIQPRQPVPVQPTDPSVSSAGRPDTVAISAAARAVAGSSDGDSDAS